VGIAPKRQAGNGEHVAGISVAAGYRQVGNGEQTAAGVVAGDGMLRGKPLVGEGPVGEGNPGNDPPGRMPVNKLVKGIPLFVPITVDVNGKPNPVNTLITSLPCAFVRVSDEVKGRAGPDGVTVP